MVDWCDTVVFRRCARDRCLLAVLCDFVSYSVLLWWRGLRYCLDKGRRSIKLGGVNRSQALEGRSTEILFHANLAELNFDIFFLLVKGHLVAELLDSWRCPFCVIQVDSLAHRLSWPCVFAEVIVAEFRLLECAG